MLKKFEQFAGRPTIEPIAHRAEPTPFYTPSDRDSIEDDTESFGTKQSIMKEIKNEIEKYDSMDKFEVIKKSNLSCTKLYKLWLEDGSDADLVQLLNQVMNVFIGSMYSLAIDFLKKGDAKTANGVLMDLKGWLEVYDLSEHEIYSTVKNEIKKLKSLL